jgi:hypothetical protein
LTTSRAEAVSAAADCSAPSPTTLTSEMCENTHCIACVCVVRLRGPRRTLRRFDVIASA